MSFKVSHTFLVNGPDFPVCSQRVLHFFAKTQLVHYDHIEIIPEHSCSALSASFQTLLDKALQKNHAKLEMLLEELDDAGYKTVADLLYIPHGYPSKILHTIAHITDGFFGIDAFFLDLDQSSYRLSEQRRQEIKQQPGNWWILTVKASSMDGGIFEQEKS
jgi:hypothetical protein